MTILDVYRQFRVPLIIVSMLVGVLIGVVVQLLVAEPSDQRLVMYVGFPGELYMSCLSAVTQPMIVISIVNGIAALEPNITGRLATQFTLYIVASKLFSVLFGMCLAIAFVQAVQRDDENTQLVVTAHRVEDKIFDLIRFILPENVIGMFFRHYETNEDSNIVLVGNVPNYVGIVTVSIVVGIALLKIGKIGTELRQVLASFYSVMMDIAGWVMWILPFCICFKLAGEIMSLDSSKVFQRVYVMYLATALTGYFVLLIVVYPLIYCATVRKNPFRFMINFVEAMTTGLAASSTMAAFPYTLENMRKDTSIDNSLSQVLIPIGHRFHLGGKTLLEGIVPIFVAHSTGTELDAGNYCTILFVGFGASFALGPFPCRLSLCSVMVLSTMGLHGGDAIVGFMMLECVIGRVGTLVDVFGDCVGVAIVSHLNQPPALAD